ncbi:MAG TPA: LuxR C-terminal-related transcriptional regulator [Anaerolineales bacterium]
MGNIWTLVTGLNDLAMVLWMQGQLHQARALFEEALAEACRQGARSLGYIARMEAGLANILYEQNELEDASRLLADAMVHIRLWPNPNHLAYAYALQSRLLLAQGDLQGARASIAEADSVRRSSALTRFNRRLVETNLIQVWLALQVTGGNLDSNDQIIDQAKELVIEWEGELTKPIENTAMRMDDSAEMAALGLARVFQAAGQFKEALSLVERAAQSARVVGHRGGLISSLLLNAIARKQTTADPGGQPPPALAALEEALSLAEPGGYVRIFLDEGKPVQMLIAQWLALARTGPLRTYAIRLLSHFNLEPDATITVQERGPQAGNLVEPLSRRELEVLHLLALGRTNQEIASQFVIALGTVKAQTANIYRKLDVTNRTEAVARARQIGILP